MVSPFVYVAGERLSEPELMAARLDGDVVALGDAFVPADLVETTALRAASLRGMLGSTLAAVLLSAAWVHGALEDPPARHSAQRAVERRLHQVIDRRFRYRDPRVEPDDLESRGGVLVTTVARTVADLARVPEPHHVDVLQAWAATDVGVLSAGRRWLVGRPRVPHRRTALELLDSLRTT